MSKKLKTSGGSVVKASAPADVEEVTALNVEEHKTTWGGPRGGGRPADPKNKLSSKAKLALDAFLLNANNQRISHSKKATKKRKAFNIDEYNSDLVSYIDELDEEIADELRSHFSSIVNNMNTKKENLETEVSIFLNALDDEETTQKFSALKGLTYDELMEEERKVRFYLETVSAHAVLNTEDAIRNSQYNRCFSMALAEANKRNGQFVSTTSTKARGEKGATAGFIGTISNFFGVGGAQSQDASQY